VVSHEGVQLTRLGAVTEEAFLRIEVDSKRVVDLNRKDARELYENAIPSRVQEG